MDPIGSDGQVKPCAQAANQHLSSYEEALNPHSFLIYPKSISSVDAALCRSQACHLVEDAYCEMGRSTCSNDDPSDFRLN